MPDILSRWLGASKNSLDRDHPNETRPSGSSEPEIDRYGVGDLQISASDLCQKQQAITQSFLRLVDLASQPLERVSRYEAILWRQFVQVLFSLDQAKYHRIAA